jgi:hypothetical protein
LKQTLQDLWGDADLRSQLLRAGQIAAFLKIPLLQLRDLMQKRDKIVRHRDHPKVLHERAHDRLADPPRRVGAEFIPAAGIKSLHRGDQPDVALLDEIEQGNPKIAILGGDAHD